MTSLSDEKLLINLAKSYDAISKACGCPIDRVKFAKHTCFLKCIDLSDITMWFARDNQNYRLIQTVMVIMCVSLLDKTFDFERWIEKIEDEYNWDLVGLNLIIHDYRSWYTRPTKEEITRVNKSREYEFDNTTGKGCSLL